MNQINSITYALSDISDVCSKLYKEYNSIRIWCFDGEIASGKTTFITNMCKMLKVKDYCSSPTYNIVNSYTTESNELIYHIDCYRFIDNFDDINFDFDFYLDNGKFIMIEWANIIEKNIPNPYLKINMLKHDNNHRIMNYYIVA